MALPVVLCIDSRPCWARPSDDRKCGTTHPRRGSTIMKASLKAHAVHPAERPEDNLSNSNPEPVMRFTNPVGNVKDGAIFFWIGAARSARGRRADLPAQQRDLVPGVLVALDRCRCPRDQPRHRSASRGGIEFKPIPGAPGPRRPPSYGFARSAP